MYVYIYNDRMPNRRTEPKLAAMISSCANELLMTLLNQNTLSSSDILMAMLKTASEHQAELCDLMDNHHDIENNDCENTKTKIIFLSFQPEVLLLWHRGRMNMGRRGAIAPTNFLPTPQN